jgi:hypothetical protein
VHGLYGHGGPWDEIQAEWARPEVGSSWAWHQRAHCAYFTAMMLRISPSWWYNLFTSSTEGGGNMSRSVAIVATFWLALAKVGRYPSLQLMAGVIPLAWARVAVRSTMRILSNSSIGS